MFDRAFSVAATEECHESLRTHLIRSDGQEDLTFALYRNVKGRTRDTAILTDVVLPLSGERRIHGNASFGPKYVERIVAMSRARKSGITFIHSHPQGSGWQGMSHDDDLAERRLAPTALAATGLPLVGLTLGGGDGEWSARRWLKAAARMYERQDASNVRVVGRRLAVSLPRAMSQEPEEAFERTDSAWGVLGRRRISALRVGIVGLGSVGSIVAETAARVGIRSLVLVDHDVLKTLNLDRSLNACSGDVGRFKVDIASAAVSAHSSSDDIDVQAFPQSCDHLQAYSALLDCDFVFSCVDRPWARRILNQLAYANLIPVSNGGLLVRTSKGRLLGVDWHVHVVGPTRRCMQCWKAFDPADAALDKAGMLDDPSYVKELDPNSPLIAHANAMPYSLGVASMQFAQFVALVAGPVYDVGDWNFHATVGLCDTNNDIGCDSECPYDEMTGLPNSLPPLAS